jgi:CHAD domain-containing protein
MTGRASSRSPGIAPRSPRSAKGSIKPEPWLTELIEVAVAARKGQNPEVVHRLRVALERLRVWLVLGRRREPRNDLRWVRGQLGALRDIDVQLALGPPEALAAKLRAERVPALRRLRRALRSDRFTRAVAALRAMPPLPRATAVRSAARGARRTVKRGDRLRRRRGDWASLHALRRAVRRTRYALDWLDEPSSHLGALQQSLGAIGDRRALIERLGRGVGERGYGKRLQRACDAHTDVVLASWAEVRKALKELRHGQAPPSPHRRR